MSEETQWYVMQGEEQLGPYTGTQLVEFATNGNIVRESFVWAEGMENWLPAGQIEGVFPPVAVAAPVPQAGWPAQGAYAPAAADPSSPYPSPAVGGASFGLWCGLLLGGVVLVIIAVVLGIVLTQRFATSGQEEVSNSDAVGMLIVGGLSLLGYVVALSSLIPFYITLYRAWKCLQPGGLARTSPGQAIGFLFIPFFNIYWLFQAIVGLATDWNRTVETYPDLKAAPRFSRGAFLACCIPPLGLFMIFPVMSQMCKGVNFFAFRPQPGQGVFQGGGTVGGLRIGGGFTKY